MKAVIYLSTISELPCEITTVSEHSVSFKITRDYATADTLQILFMMNAGIYEYSDSISVSVKRDQVDNIVFVD